MQTLFHMVYLPLRVSLISLKYTELPPYLGSTLRGVTGQALREIDREAYHFLYENGKKGGGEQDVGKPYVIVPPRACGVKTTMEQGEILDFDFLLFGRGIQYAQALIRALGRVGEYGLGAQRAPFGLLQIAHGEDGRMIWREDQAYSAGLRPVELPCRRLPQAAGAVVRLVTPLRIRRKGQLVTSIPFPTLIRNITTRTAAMTERYGGWTDQEEAARLQRLAEQIRMTREELRLKRLERYSNRLGEKMDFSGLLGELAYEGDLTPFVPWLYAAQVLHVGRNTTFGMGRIQVYFF